jgi:hypothetical protein
LRALSGFDLMFDAYCHPWILEVNLDPSLATDSPLDLRVKGAVLTDLLNVVGVGAPATRDHAPTTSASVDAAAGSVTAEEAAVLHRVDAEARRARLGGFRRLHPSLSSTRGAYAPFFEPSRARLNTLNFEVE